MDEKQIEDHIVNFFQDLYTEPFHYHPYLKGVEFDYISREKVDWPKRPFKEEEILAALKSLLNDKCNALPRTGVKM